MSTLSVGAQLSQARVARKLTWQDVTRATKIQAWVLENMEKDQLLPGMSPVYAKGFVSTYAKFLGLDPAPLVAQLLPQPELKLVAAEQPEKSLEARSPARTAQWDSAREMLWLLIRRGATVAAAAGVIAFVVNTRPMKQLAKHTPARVKTASVAVAKPELAKPEPPVPALRLVTPPAQPAQSLLELSITARKQTWISVKSDGTLIAQQKLPAGAQETWKARRRFEIVIGAPGKVDVTLNGRSITPMVLAHQGRMAITHSGITPLDDDSAR